MDFGAVGRGKQRADLVARAIDLRGLASRRAVEEIDEAPGDVLGVGLECGIGEQGEQVRPDGREGLLARLFGGKVCFVERCGSNRKAGQIESGKLGGEAVVHGSFPPERRRLPQGKREVSCGLFAGPGKDRVEGPTHRAAGNPARQGWRGPHGPQPCAGCGGPGPVQGPHVRTGRAGNLTPASCAKRATQVDLQPNEGSPNCSAVNSSTSPEGNAASAVRRRPSRRRCQPRP